MTTETRRATGWRLLAIGSVLAGILGPWSIARAAVPDGNSFYVRSDTWAETMRASRDRYARWWQGQLDGVKLGPWHTAEQKDGLALEGPIDLAAPEKNGNRQWQVRHDLPDAVVHYDLSNHGVSEQRRIPRTTEPDQAKVELPLMAGKNQLVMRLLGHRWCGFYFATTPHDAARPTPIAALLEQLACDFPIATDRMQGDVR